MGKPAARLTDIHACPIHPPNAIIQGSPNVFTDSLPAARVTDKEACTAAIVAGSAGVFINGLPAARLSDPTSHGGKIATGSPDVFIGETKSPPVHPKPVIEKGKHADGGTSPMSEAPETPAASAARSAAAHSSQDIPLDGEQGQIGNLSTGQLIMESLFGSGMTAMRQNATSEEVGLRHQLNMVKSGAGTTALSPYPVELGVTAATPAASFAMGEIGAVVAEVKEIGVANAILSRPAATTVAATETSLLGGALATGADTPLSAPASATRKVAGKLLNEVDVPKNIRYTDLPNDLVADSKGVYGYLPTSDSQFHSSKWPVDWSNIEQVSAARATRLEYHAGLEKKQEFVNTLRLEGVGDDDIARQIVEMRNQDRLSHYKTPEALEVVYQRNIAKYGNKTGPSYESQIAKYGTSTEVINAALRSNDTMDILTGIAKPKE